MKRMSGDTVSCMHISSTSSQKSSERATKSVSQLTSMITPSLLPHGCCSAICCLLSDICWLMLMLGLANGPLRSECAQGMTAQCESFLDSREMGAYDLRAQQQQQQQQQQA